MYAGPESLSMTPQEIETFTMKKIKFTFMQEWGLDIPKTNAKLRVMADQFTGGIRYQLNLYLLVNARSAMVAGG